MCRLFGFSAVIDKYGKQKIAHCSPIKINNPDIGKKIQEMIDNGLEIPLFTYYNQIIFSLNPNLAQIKYPINEAFKIAMDIVGYRMTFYNTPDNHDEPPENKPTGNSNFRKSA